jgi:uncharacterized membrane protein YfcA
MVTGTLMYVVALVAALAISMLASPAGVSGAALLLPFQVAVLGTPSPAVTPTNLLYNVVATPGALYRYRRQGQRGGQLARTLVAGSLPGVILGSIIRVELVPGERAFHVVIALVMIPLGVWSLAARAPSSALQRGRRDLSTGTIAAMALVVGGVGGVYGIGGGAIMAPILIGAGRPASEVAPATLAATLVTSIAGVGAFVLLSLGHHSSVAPDWGVGVALGAGGLAGGYLGARLQPRLPERAIRRLLGLLVLAIGIRYGWLTVS